jgi:hypothetical protein
MNRLTLCAILVAAGSGCGRASPLSPDAALVTISGYVYFQAPAGEPMIDNALVTVADAEGSEDGSVPRWLAATNGDGFYAVTVRPGRISITASKEGYEAKVWHLQLSDDTVLNFSLTPK